MIRSIKTTRKIAARNYYVAGKSSKVCPSCNKELPLTFFPIAKKRQSGRASHCKECRKNKYPYNAVSKRSIHLRHRYGIEIDEYIYMYNKQGGTCAICQSMISIDKTSHVDHCHKTGKVRGLLCFMCNSALGKFKDSKQILLRAIDYLNEK